MRYALAAPPAEPVTTAEAKAHLRVTGSAEDAYIASLVGAARAACERFARRSLVRRTVTTWFDGHEGSPYGSLPLVLPWGPVASVTSVTAYDSDDAAAAVDAAAYVVAGDRLALAEAAGAPVWPTDLRGSDAVEVVYEAGPEVADVDPDARHAVLVALADLYENRSSLVVGTVASRLPQDARSLLAPLRPLHV